MTVVRGLVEQVGDFAPFVVDDRKAADKAAKALGATLKEELKPLRDNLRALALGAGLESALFGRMVTSDPSSNKDAPVHVAHAFTVHAQERELDFVTVIDDLLRLDDAAGPGSAGMFDADLTSGLYYGYVNVDVELLMANLQGDASVAARVAAQLVQLIARVSPGAKKGSTAPFAHAEWVMVEAGDDQPRTLANAFRKAVPLKSESDVYAEAMTSLQGHLNQLDRAYGVGARRAQLCVTEPALNDVPRHDIAGLGAWIGSQLRASAS